MKVLHVEAGMHLYGGALQVVFLLRGLKERGVDCVLACPDGSAIAREAAPHAQVVTLPMKGDLDVGLLGRLRRLIRDVRPDVVHLHSRRGSDIWGALAGRLEGVPVVLSRRVDNPEARWVVNLKYRLYDEVITISDGIRQVLLSEGVPAHKLHCVLSAVDTQQYQPNRQHLDWFRDAFQVAPDELVIGMVAQFIQRKGHQTLLDALPAVFAQHPRTKVILFGQGPIRDAIQARVQASPELAARVQLPGFRRDLEQILPCLDILAHPAFMEGLGVSLLQAAACGVPLVGGRAGGIPEIIQPGLNGELIEPGDVAALSSALNTLLASEDLRQRYGESGRKWVEKFFSIAAMVEGNWLVYKRTLNIY
ncbi:MAG: glycosyltransferase family 4 protein [Aquabacterium sp.]|jgi:glycosyltransferase involved in cell wall biosynthesis|uniref:glycosyltransferase family 4 protein n=1 Tax=Aquabacterium sp. TaxID=1872578 RepID=UPI002A369F0C|nr:glycosyltransferase family 4 protein [Aquabacterium sp.]MDX9844571.1 glycosyltransferase family 4 protein [Aquabacterium sp.]